MGLDHLERHEAVQAPLSGPKDDPHAAPANLFEKVVIAEMADLRSGGRRFKCSFGNRAEAKFQETFGAMAKGRIRLHRLSALSACFYFSHSIGLAERGERSHSVW